MEVAYDDEAKNDLRFWKDSGNIAIQKKISKLIKSIEQNPFEGIGKPEQLKHDLAGKWSRRINQEHRIVYQIKKETILIHSLRGHY